MAEEKTFSAKQVATRIGTEAKILRKFFRDPKSGYKAVGQGGRYDFPESEIAKIKQAFDAWNAGKVRRNRPTNAERKLAEKAGVVPQPRKEAQPKARRNRNTPPASPLDEDDLMTRCRQSIGQRARAKGLTTNKQGQWVKGEGPTMVKPLMTVEELERKVPGFKKARLAADKRWDERKKHDFEEVLEEVLHEAKEPTPEELDKMAEEDGLYDELIDEEEV